MLLLPVAAHAQVVERTDSTAMDQLPSRWSAGLAVVYRDSEYAGEGGRTRLLPNVAYDGERFYLRGAAFGYRAYTDDRFELRAFVAGRLDGIDADDFGRAELARRGIDRDLLEDRDDSADAGVAASWKGAAGKLELDVRADVTGTSDGYAVSLDYSYPIRFGSTSVVPSVGAVRLSDDMANYYYGTLDREIARGVVAYRPGAVTVPRAGVAVIRPFAKRWAFIANLEYRALPDELKDSPLVEEGANGSGSLFIGISRGF
ncbi:MipA/OmpV family protein [Pseudoxanthomonas putridarboris]|uniref:MipA/OmpV family protein n=1 Tax=Pseudoxanthomonas putridarboris TaxID=752605 RepID=A0ABU9IZH2_9GAMM